MRRLTEQAVGTCLRAARSPAGGMAGLPVAALAQIEDAAAGILSAVDNCPEAAMALDDLASADSYTYSHSVRVATLGLLLGQRINRLDGWVDWRGQRRYRSASCATTTSAGTASATSAGAPVRTPVSSPASPMPYPIGYSIPMPSGRAAVVDGEVHDPALPADGRPAGDRAPDGVDSPGPPTGRSLRELDRTATR